MSGVDGTSEAAARSSVLLLGAQRNDGMSSIYTKSWDYLLSDFFPVLDSRGGCSREKM